MATRKIFSDNEGKELSYKIDSEGELRIEISMADGTLPGITLEVEDAIQFISELNKIRRKLLIEGK